MKCNGNMQSACLYVVGKMEPKSFQSGILISFNHLFFQNVSNISLDGEKNLENMCILWNHYYLL